MSGKPVVYWDTSAFLCLLLGETTHGDDALRALVSQANAFDRGAILLATSVIGIAEVLRGDLPDRVREQFEQMIRRKNFLSMSATESIARDAARLRNHCHAKAKATDPGEPYLLTTPDAIHVATAMRVGADVLVTLDAKSKVVETKRRELGMTQVTRYYPVPDLACVAIELPALGLPGTSLLG